MARMKMEQETTEERVAASMPNPSAGGGTYLFSPAPAGFYDAIVKSITERDYEAGYGQYTNPAKKSGLWDYVALRPSIVVRVPREVDLEGEGVMTDGEPVVEYDLYFVGQQDFTLGVINNTKDRVLLRPDGDKTKSPIFMSETGAHFLLKELGLYSGEGTKLILDVDFKEVENRGLRVKLGTGAYCKGWSKDMEEKYFPESKLKFVDKQGKPKTGRDFNPVQLATLYQAITGEKEFTLEELIAVVDAYNVEQGWTEENEALGEGIRLKNVITGFYSLNYEQAKEAGWYYDEPTKTVFTDEAAYRLWTRMQEIKDNSGSL